MPRASHSACVKYEGAGGGLVSAIPVAWRALQKLASSRCLIAWENASVPLRAEHGPVAKARWAVFCGFLHVS